MVMSKYPLEHLQGSQPVEGLKRDEGERGRYSQAGQIVGVAGYGLEALFARRINRRF
jgi:hypothetical protein